MNLFPEQLRQIAAMCESLNKADSDDHMAEGTGLFLGAVPVVTEDGMVAGHLRDEIGGAWSFFPKGDTQPAP